MIRPGVKHQLVGRLALTGPEGAGKTLAALTAARILAGEGDVLVLDTEHERALRYADRFRFDHLAWPGQHDPRILAEVLDALPDRYDVVVIDSLSHFWVGSGGTLEIVDQATATQRSGNKFTSGWSVGTPAQTKMTDAIQAAAAHVVATMRVKTEYALELGADGKQRPVKIGLAPIQRDGIGFEFDVLADFDAGHAARMIKLGPDELDGTVWGPDRLEQWLQIIADWLGTGIPPSPPVDTDTREALVARAKAITQRVGREALDEAWHAAKMPSLRHPTLTEGEAERWSALLEDLER